MTIASGLLLMWIHLAAKTEGPGGSSGADRVLVVANETDSVSMDLARHYVERRHLPMESIVAVRTTHAERMPAAEFADAVWNPLLDAVHARGLAEWDGLSDPDTAGRRHPTGARAAMLRIVVIRGVPTHVLPPAGAPGWGIDRGDASLDSELALLLSKPYELRGVVPNPWFRGARSPNRADAPPLVCIGRLDGPSADSVRSVIDRTIEAERHGLWGRGYVDMGGPYPMGEGWLERAADLLEAAGIPVVRDRRNGVFQDFERFDSPVVYLGWYRQNLTGVFERPGFEFPAGALALHIHSQSATPLRSETHGWAGPLVERGAAAVMGNTAEPFLQYTHRPDFFVEGILAGESAAEAALKAHPALSWMGVFLGDPLHVPFPGGRDALLERARASADPYSSLIAANLISVDSPSQALDLLRERARKTRHPVVAMAWLDRATAVDDAAVAARALSVCDWGDQAIEPALLNEAIELLRRRRMDDEAGLLTQMRRARAAVIAH